MDPFFRRLIDIFTSINTHITFLSSHARNSIPTYDVITKLNADIKPVDLAMIKCLFPPGHVYFEYVDENQIELWLADEVKTSEKGYHSEAKNVDDAYAQLARPMERLKQVLVFDFHDLRVDGIGARIGGRFQKPEPPKMGFFTNLTKLTLNTLSQENMKLMIKGRQRRFIKYVDDFIASHDRPQQELIKLAVVPAMVDYDDDLVENQGKRRKKGERRPALDSMYDCLVQEPFYSGQIKFEGDLTTVEPAKYHPFVLEMDGEHTIHPQLVDAFKARGIDIGNQMYSHQSEALEVLLLDGGHHVIVSTSTGLGKSLIYQIPILNDILWDRALGKPPRSSTAIFIFPTKALAQDQKQNLQKLIATIPLLSTVVVDTYDGDTPSKTRQNIRNSADIIFTNPDTIHAAILPGAEVWKPFLDNLAYVVVDEIHVYRGLFGIHVSFVMARLHRMTLAPFKFILCSATIKNAADHFRIVCSIPKSQPILHVDNDGSPHNFRRLLVWQPPPLMNKQGVLREEDTPFVARESIIGELAKILCQLLTQVKDVKVLVFCPLRKVCEYLMKEVRELLNLNSFLNRTGVRALEVMSYRGGYAKEDRRAIEQKMFNGELRAIVATNALELGIDLLDLDVVITCGFPISKLNLHQQFGRAGRGRDSKGSLAIFVGGGNAVDTYYIDHGSELVNKDYEDLCVGLLMELGSHRMIMEMHMQCAAFERPLTEEDSQWFDKRFYLAILGSKLHKDGLGRYRCDPLYLPWPPEKVGLRAVEETLYAIVDITNGRNIVLEEIEMLRVPFTIYDGAIFLHQGNPYLVREFNAEGQFAKVERVNVTWTTSQRDFTDIDPVEVEYVKQFFVDNKPTNLPVFYGKIRSEMKVFGYFKINRRGEILEAVDVDQPLVIMYLKGFWIDVPLKAIEVIRDKQLNPAAGIHAAQHAIMNILPLFISGGASTNPNVRWTSSVGEAELNTECKAPEKEFASRQSQRKRPSRIIFYDSKGGPQGLGMLAKTFEYIDAIIHKTFDRVFNCDCEWGCPRCVHGTFCKEKSMVISKPAAIIILAAILAKPVEEYRDLVEDGPEDNLPVVEIDTIGPATRVKFSGNVEVIEPKNSS